MKSMVAATTSARARGGAAAGYDVAVFGAGVFGCWTAYHLQRAGRRVVLVDPYGPGNSRASSGGESRVIRMGYGPDEIYTRWSMRSLEIWRDLLGRAAAGGPPLLHPIGVLWLAKEDDAYSMRTIETLTACRVPFEKLARPHLERRYPQMSFGDVSWGMLEPGSGALMARRAVEAVSRAVVEQGGEVLLDSAAPPAKKGRLESITTRSGRTVRAETFVFACGPWLAKVFPTLLGGKIHPTRQEVFFFGVPAADARFSPPALPVWIDFPHEIYGIPNLEARGFKVAPDRHGPAFDPDTGDRVVPAKSVPPIRDYLARRFPALRDAPLVETRVCQYENTSNGDFLIDRHPEMENVWLIGGGSGHGFKHGPALGEYVAARIGDGKAVEARFTLSAKQKVQKRAVF
jgi:sarcosine oxidase